ncbi:hypothetical protein AVEN_189886-1 [Araneus ventricosus]|uniref:CCHC-type domain-containing protein n=1 Tax=Araneus ventricosus TaxID=182803 RepID=A0A4Y2EFT0_ARAVE|nr:hypothetical protein AVEN_189886-1 [Araneus ventricosus]
MATSKDFKTGALHSESLLGLATLGVKSKTSKSKSKLENMRYGSLDDFQEGAKVSKSGLPGKQGSKKALHAPGPVVKPYVFGQRNPFELQPLGVAPPVAESAVSSSSTTGDYVGFGLSVGLPPGTKWGDTLYPGVDGDDVGVKVDKPGVHQPLAGPFAPGPAVSAVEVSDVRPSEDAMDEDPKAGHKRKKDKVLVPDTPAEATSETDSSSGEIPDTPLKVRPPGSYYERLCPEMKTTIDSFVAKFPGNDNLVENIWILMYAIDAQFVGLRKRLDELEGTVAASAVPADRSFAQAVGKPRPDVRDIGTDPPQLLGVSGPGRVPQRKKRQGPTLQTEGSGTSKGIADPSPGTLQEGVVAPQLVSRPQAPPLPSRQSLNGVVVTPIRGDIESSEQLKVLLESSLHLKTLGVEVLGCSPAANRGVLVRVRTPDMVNVLKQAINTHGSLKEVCVARKPLRRSPRIMLYDVPVTDMVKEAEEVAFLQKLRSSNSIPESMDIRVLFRKPGRGSSQHWILSVAPELFSTIKCTNRLFFGFGSFKFREYLEPTQYYKCLQFGHLRAICSALKEFCTRCSGDHSYRVCTAASVACSRCMEYNRRRGTGQKVRTDHSAISVRCPVYLREREEMGRQYV